MISSVLALLGAGVACHGSVDMHDASTPSPTAAVGIKLEVCDPLDFENIQIFNFPIKNQCIARVEGFGVKFRFNFYPYSKLFTRRDNNLNIAAAKGNFINYFFGDAFSAPASAYAKVADICGRLPLVFHVDIYEPLFGSAVGGFSKQIGLSESYVGAGLSFGTLATLTDVEKDSRESASGQKRLQNDSPEIGLRPMGGPFLSDNIPLFALVAFIPIGVGLIFSGFGKFIRNAVNSRHPWRWGVLGHLTALLGAALAATGVTGLLGG